MDDVTVSTENLDLITAFFKSVEGSSDTDVLESEMLDKYFDLCALFKVDPNDPATIDVIIQKCATMLGRAVKKSPYLANLLSKLTGKFIRLELKRKIQKMIEMGKKRSKKVAPLVASSLNAIIPLHFFWQSMAMENYMRVYKILHDMIKSSSVDVGKVIDQAEMVMKNGLSALAKPINGIKKLSPEIIMKHVRDIIEPAVKQKIVDISGALGITIRHEDYNKQSMDNNIKKLLSVLVNALKNEFVDIQSPQIKNLGSIAEQIKVLQLEGLNVDNKLAELLTQCNRYMKSAHKGTTQMTR